MIAALSWWGFEDRRETFSHFSGGAQKVNSLLELSFIALAWCFQENKHGSLWFCYRKGLMPTKNGFQ